MDLDNRQITLKGGKTERLQYLVRSFLRNKLLCIKLISNAMIQYDSDQLHQIRPDA